MRYFKISFFYAILTLIYIHLHLFRNKSALYMLQHITELPLTMSHIYINW
jgi:hypothetical protein